MIKHFSKMKQYIKLSAILTPLLSFTAFLFYTIEMEAVTLVIGLTAFIVASSFPHEKEVETNKTKIKWNLSSILKFIPMLLCVWWFSTLEAFKMLVIQVSQGALLLDWRIITSVFIWHIFWGHTSFKKASAIDDAEILNIYESRSKT